MGQEIKFSEREKQVNAHLVQGKSNKQIALALGVSVRAIEFHLSNIYAKLGVASRTEAALKLAEIDLRESTGTGLRQSAVDEATDTADNGEKSISSRRIRLKKLFSLGLSLLIMVSAIFVGSYYLLEQQRNSSVGAPPSPTTGSTVPLPQPTETLITSRVSPQPTPQDALGSGTISDDPFVFDLRLFRDSTFNQHPVATSLYSDMDGVGVWMYWFYTGTDPIGPVETYWGTLPQLDQLLQETYDSIQFGSSGGRTGGVMLPGGFFIPGESKPGDRVQVALKVVTPNGEYGAVLIFTLQQGANGLEPSDISVDVLKSITSTPIPTVSSKEHILEQIRRLVAEYDQAVQAEKKNGDVEFSEDSQTGEEIFLFKNESYIRIMEREEKLWEDINQLNKLYVQLYRDEVRPTPFPTSASTAEARTQYDALIQQSGDICSNLWNLKPGPETVLVYRVDDGKYLPIGVGDDYARCEVHGQMIEEWRTAPLLTKVNKEADMALIRQIVGKPELELSFQSISNIANAPWQSAALYADETGTKYYVDIETARLATIEPNFPGHPEIPPDETKSMDELRGIARQFAITNSPRLAELETVLLYEEKCKGDICFFRWDYRNKDWTGTDWAMMPPFLQVGVLANGEIATDIDTLDLFK